jgi:hypothetical protein
MAIERVASHLGVVINSGYNNKVANVVPDAPGRLFDKHAWRLEGSDVGRGHVWPTAIYVAIYANLQRSTHASRKGTFMTGADQK